MSLKSINYARLSRVGISSPLSIRNSRVFYSTETPVKKKKSAPVADISQIPIKSIGVIADFYIPPKFLKSPVLSWHKLLFRRLGAFAINTYSIVKYRRETGLKLKFNDWKEAAIEQFVKTNKIFAAACNSPKAQRESYLKSQLDGVTGVEVMRSLTNRALTFPPNTKLNWELVSVESNPKIVSFNTLPDSNNIAAYVQFVVQVSTKQKLTITQVHEEPKVTERTLTDNLVYTLDPFSNELVLVGTLFPSDHIRGVQPEINFTNSQMMQAFQKSSADIFRANK